MKSTQVLDALFVYATEGIIVVNEKGVITRVNPSALKMFGYKQEEIEGKTIEILIPARLSQVHQKHRTKYNAHPHARAMGTGYDLNGLRKDGSEFPVEISLSPYSNKEGKFVIAFIIDITHRKKAEEDLKNYSAELEKQVRKRTLILEEAIHELEKTKAELNKALEKERELSELKSRFVSMASHEFRTPLATILSSVALIARYTEKGDREKQLRHIEKIKSAITNLTDILNDFLSVSKLEEGKVESVPEKFDIKDFMTDTLREMEPLAKEGQKLIYQHSGKQVVLLDKKLLKNILFNLLSNAIKFSPEEQPIEINSSFGSSLKISVKDHGIGISTEDQEYLFTRFFRGNNATNIQGTGLGLNIVSKYVELMNGSIKFASHENKGSTFIISFPQ